MKSVHQVLQTLAGLAALMVMQLRIGMDMGLVLCKGIICSLVTVFFIMPGLLLAFSDKIDKTTHRSFVPSIEKWCKVVIKLKNIVPYIFYCDYSSRCGAFVNE